MKITKQEIQIILAEELSVALDEQSIVSRVASYLKSLAGPRRDSEKEDDEEEESTTDADSTAASTSTKTPASAKTKDFPIQITVDEFSEFINKSNFSDIKKIFDKLPNSKMRFENEKQIKQFFIKNLGGPTGLFKIFDDELSESVVGDYFRLQTTTNEQIDIKQFDTGNPRINLLYFLFGVLLKKYIKKRSEEVEGIVADLDPEVLRQLQNSVIGTTTNTLSSIFNSSGKAPQPKPAKATPEPEKETPSRIDLLKPPRSLRDVKGSENYKKFMASLLDFFANQMKIDIKIAKKIVRDIWAKTPVSGKFNKLVFKEQMEKEIDIAAILADSELNPTQQIKVLGALKKWAAQNSDLIDNRMTQILRLRDKEEQKPQPAAKSQTAAAPAGEEEAEVEKNFDTETGLPISEKGRNSIIKQIGNVTEKDEFFNLYDKLANSKFSNKNRKVSFDKARKNRDYKYLSGFDAGPEAQNTIRQKFKDLFLTDKGEAETDRIQPAPEPVSEPQATEEPLKIITKILGEKGVDEEKVSAFMNDLRELGVIQEINSKRLRRSLKMNTAEWQQFSQKHKEVIEAIGELRGRRNTQLQKQFVNALSGIVIRTSFPRAPRGPRKKKSTAASKSKNDSTPAAETPAKPAPQAVPEPAPVPEPEPADSKNTKSDPEDTQQPPKHKKKAAPRTKDAKDQKAYEHGKQGKTMSPEGDFIDKSVLPSAIDNAIRLLNSNKPSLEDQEKQDLRDKIESYIDGLYVFKDENETSAKLEESLMLRWKTIAGIK